jgi:lipopolysaccharide export system protein LptA
MNKVFFTVILLLCIILPAFAQQHVKYKATVAEFDKIIAPDAWRLVGNVVFTEGSTNMYCDSAYYYQSSDDIDAFGNIRIIPDPVTTLTGKILHYKAIEKTANLSGGVVLVNDSATLTTQTIFYNMSTGIAHYPTKGTIQSGTTTIVSDEGIYDKNIKKAYFKKNVVVTNPESVIHTDTMHYNTTSKVVDFFGPTIIVSNNNDSIYCEKGWYNTSNDIASFRQNAWLKGNGSFIKADTLYYEKHTGLGKAYGNIESIDTSNNVIIRGDYATYDQIKKSALVTKNALMIQVDNLDSLYLHADTIYSGTFIDTVRRAITNNILIKDSVKNHCDSLLANVKDSIGSSLLLKTGEKDSLNANTNLTKDTSRLASLPDSLKYKTYIDTFKFVNAYHHVKFYRSDIQGKSDSLYYSFKDSTLRFFGKPALWAANSQLTAEHIKIYTKNQKMDKMEMKNLAFVVSRQDSSNFNQIKGRNMTGFFNKNKISKLLVIGNGQTIYFAIDKNVLIGVNKCESSDITLYFKDKDSGSKKKTTQLDKITYKKQVSGVFHPPHELSGSDLKLKDFMWLEKQKPKSWHDVFIWLEDSENDKEKGQEKDNEKGVE